MKGWKALALIAVLIWAAPAAAEMRLYVEKGAADTAQIQRMMLVLGGEDETVSWTLMDNSQPLRDLVLSGNAPDLAVCSPAAARPWAEEGMLLPLSTRIPDQKRMQRQVLDLCVQGEELFMAPLIARHRQMAVNRRMFEAMGLGYMLDRQAYPVWYPAQFYQILEEFMIRDQIAVDVWRASSDTVCAIETLTQAVFGGELLSEDGQICHAGTADMIAGVQWLADSVEAGMIGWQPSREAALERFLNGETAIWIDWTDELEKRLTQANGELTMDLVTMPYPSALGMSVRSFELTGVCAFLSEENARNARLLQACAQLHGAAQETLGPRGIWQDGALWPASLEADDTGATLRSLFCEAVNCAVEQGEAADALWRVQAAMDALQETE